jgi:hypothetical protein
MNIAANSAEFLSFAKLPENTILILFEALAGVNVFVISESVGAVPLVEAVVVGPTVDPMMKSLATIRDPAVAVTALDALPFSHPVSAGVTIAFDELICRASVAALPPTNLTVLAVKVPITRSPV